MQVYVGLTVQWFVRGNKDAPPLPAIVTVVHPGGMLSLSVCDENSVWSTRRSVWQLGAPQLAGNPKLTEKAGAWDFAGPKFTPECSPSKSESAPVENMPTSTLTSAGPEVKTREAIEVAKKKELQKAATPA